MTRKMHLMLVAFFVALWTVPLFAQEAIPSETPAGDVGNIISTQVVISYLLVWIGEVIKRTKALPWFEDGAAVANRVMASVFAAAQTVGIGASFDTTAGTLMVTGLSLSVIIPTAVEFGRAYITQKLLWVMAFKRPTSSLAHA